MQPQTQDVAVFALLTVLAVSKKTREAVALQMIRLYDYVAVEADLLRFPLSENGEKLLIAFGSIAFYITKVKNLRKYPLSHLENQTFFQTMAIGLVLGLLMDLY